MDRDDRTLMGESGRERERVWSIVLAAADQFVDKLVVLGVVPDGLEVDYGWMSR